MDTSISGPNRWRTSFGSSRDRINVSSDRKPDLLLLQSTWTHCEQLPYEAATTAELFQWSARTTRWTRSQSTPRKIPSPSLYAVAGPTPRAQQHSNQAHLSPSTSHTPCDPPPATPHRHPHTTTVGSLFPRNRSHLSPTSSASIYLDHINPACYGP